MTVNIDALISCLGKTYQELIDNELINYKSPPTGSSGDPDLSLDMAKEGLFLSFKRDGRILQAIVVKIQNDKAKNWMFPNELPKPLQRNMSRKWVHENIGVPLRSSPPKVVMRRVFGWTDLYEAQNRLIPTMMQISYDTSDQVRSVTFLPASDLRW
ncbi:pyocin immunity protein [Rosenbergiella sp. S61]|uniref:Pyocin immunity protein n=1 Tax=Rosenbergiella gaditana TaxID=2726987 RepID=A0ABS5SUZ0_9GAMM|nr:DUF6392 family protein [Rosenbergiella gaditana]MBT0723925.1 pyocin immunity protein [Rosenbergiella gaditana]